LLKSLENFGREKECVRICVSDLRSNKIRRDPKKLNKRHNPKKMVLSVLLRTCGLRTPPNKITAEQPIFRQASLAISNFTKFCLLLAFDG
jgi:hypothetical protein